MSSTVDSQLAICDDDWTSKMAEYEKKNKWLFNGDLNWEYKSEKKFNDEFKVKNAWLFSDGSTRRKRKFSEVE